MSRNTETRRPVIMLIYTLVEHIVNELNEEESLAFQKSNDSQQMNKRPDSPRIDIETDMMERISRSSGSPERDIQLTPPSPRAENEVVCEDRVREVADMG
ncbi:hypothetical protein A2U01_0032945, partial [Trifolium medium]|nr:hypothetical protein [Trifolium medium]